MGSYSSLVLGHASLRWYGRLGEGSGTTLDDIGPNNLDGTYAATGITYGVAGAIANDANTAVTFDGSSNYIEVVDNNALDLGDGSFSIEFWVKRSATQGAIQAFFNKGTNAYLLRFQAANTIALLKGGVAGAIVSTGTITDTTTYHHIVFTKSGSARKAYADGVDVTSLGTDQTLADSTSSLFIGTVGASQRFPGSMDEIAIYGAVLTPAEVLEHFQVGKGIVGNAASVSLTAHPPALATSVAAPSTAVTVAAQVPTVAVSVAPPVTTVTDEAQVPSVALSVESPATALTLSALPPTIQVADGVIAPTAAIVVSAQAPALTTSSTIAAPTASITVSAQAPSLGVPAPVPTDGGAWIVRRPLKRRLDVLVELLMAGHIELRAQSPGVIVESTYEDELLLLTA